MRTFLFIYLTLLVFQDGNGQIPNPGFELLDSTSQLANWRYPTMLTFNLGDSIVSDGQAVGKSTDARSGTYALELRNNYDYTTNSSYMDAGASVTVPDDNLYQGFNLLVPFLGKPAALAFWFKFSQNPMNDSLICSVKIFNSSEYEIASGYKIVGSSNSSYNSSSVPLNYLTLIPPGDGDSIPAFIKINFRNRLSPGPLHVGQRTLIDDLTLIQTMVGLTEIRGNKSVQVFPNPVKDILVLACDKPVYIEIYNQLGELVRSGEGKTLNIENLAQGVYQVRIDHGAQVRKIVKE